MIAFDEHMSSGAMSALFDRYSRSDRAKVGQDNPAHVFGIGRALERGVLHRLNRGGWRHAGQAAQVSWSVGLWPASGRTVPAAVDCEFGIESWVLDAPGRGQTAMQGVGRARRRDGAVQWTLAADAERPTRHLESYLVSSWAEHEREQSRLTQADARPLQTAYDLHRGQTPPSVRYLLGHQAPSIFTADAVGSPGHVLPESVAAPP